MGVRQTSTDELVEAIRSRHWKARRTEKGRMLDEFVAATGCLLAFIPAVAQQRADDRPVLLLHVRLVVLSVGTTPGERDLLLLTKADEVGVQDLASIVRVDPQERKRWRN
jgi:hypothetical protein